MLDKSVKYVGLVMIKEDMDNYPRYDLPEGYSFVAYQDNYEKDWARIKVAVEEARDLEHANEIFRNEFLKDTAEAYKRCWFVKDENDKIVATSSLWYGDNFGQRYDRVHWVSTDPEYQNKGLIKAMFTKLMDLHNELGCTGLVYLTTQTTSYKAINIYEQFGFKAYKGKKPKDWYNDEDYNNLTDIGWVIVREKIDAYNNKKRSVK